MSVIETGLIAVGGEYDFQGDPFAGAVGTYDMNIVIPQFSQIESIKFVTVTPFTSGTGAATLSVGMKQIGILSPAGQVDYLSPVGNLAFYNSQSSPFAGLIQSNLTWSFPGTVKTTTDMTVTFSIGVEALTAGRMQCIVLYALSTN